jgi:hypothetical protein
MGKHNIYKMFKKGYAFISAWTHTHAQGQDELDASFEAFPMVMFQVLVFWVVTPCSVVVEYQRFTFLPPSSSKELYVTDMGEKWTFEETFSVDRKFQSYQNLEDGGSIYL